VQIEGPIYLPCLTGFQSLANSPTVIRGSLLSETVVVVAVAMAFNSRAVLFDKDDDENVGNGTLSLVLLTLIPPTLLGLGLELLLGLE
jgi:hypothetical protein